MFYMSKITPSQPAKNAELSISFPKESLPKKVETRSSFLAIPKEKRGLFIKIGAAAAGIFAAAAAGFVLYPRYPAYQISPNPKQQTFEENLPSSANESKVPVINPEEINSNIEKKGTNFVAGVGSFRPRDFRTLCFCLNKKSPSNCNEWTIYFKK